METSGLKYTVGMLYRCNVINLFYRIYTKYTEGPRKIEAYITKNSFALYVT